MWRLLIIEDASELLGKDARVQAGQGLARLLNLCDGLVGQGLRVLILITTNEDVGTMHPAVIRRGRCIANIRFDLLSPEERRDWSAAHGVSPDDELLALLADLFAADQIAQPRERDPCRFSPPEPHRMKSASFSRADRSRLRGGCRRVPQPVTSTPEPSRLRSKVLRGRPAKLFTPRPHRHRPPPQTRHRSP